MNKYFRTKIISSAFLICTLIILSCGNNQSENNTETTANTGNASKTTTTPAVQSLNTGALDVLYIGRATFDNLNNGTRMVFAHSMAANNKINLTGWVQQGNQFPNATMVSLINGPASEMQYGPGTYFGNVLLRPDQFNNIKTALNNAAMLYVVFTPIPVDNFIGYDISVSGSIPSLAAQATNTVAQANPSPPRDSQ